MYIIGWGLTSICCTAWVLMYVAYYLASLTAVPVISLIVAITLVVIYPGIKIKTIRHTGNCLIELIIISDIISYPMLLCGCLNGSEYHVMTSVTYHNEQRHH